MHAIEFETQTYNGIVQIPEKYLAWNNRKVKVILSFPRSSVGMQPGTLQRPVFTSVRPCHCNELLWMRWLNTFRPQFNFLKA